MVYIFSLLKWPCLLVSLGLNLVIIIFNLVLIFGLLIYFWTADESCLTNGYLETILDWIPGMEGISLRDLPRFISVTPEFQ